MKHERLRKRFLLPILAMALAIAAPVVSPAAVFELNQEFSGAQEPVGTDAWWLKATFTNYATDTVQLVLDSGGLVGTEFVSIWAFNFENAGIDVVDLDIAYQALSSTAPDALSISQAADGYKADGDGLYDIVFFFPKAGSADRFGMDETATFLITGTGITEGDFNVLSAPAGGHGPFYSAAHVQGIGADGEGSGWIAPGATPVPEPGTMMLLGSGLIGVAGWGRKKFRNKKQSD